MIKKIITLVVCLALCVSCIAVGVVNQTAKDSSIDAAANGAIEGIAVSQDYPNSVLAYDSAAGEYYFTTDTVKIESTNDDTYKDLYAIFNRTATGDGGTALKLNGRGATIETSVPLFDAIANTTIENLTVTGSDMTITSDTAMGAYGTDKTFGVIADSAYETVTFNNVTVDVNITYTADTTTTVSIGAFVGHATKINMTKCTNKGNITFEASTGEVSLGGLLGKTENSGAFVVKACVNLGDITGTRENTTASGNLYLGGLAACVYTGEGASSVEACVNAGAVTGTYVDTVFAGGMIGMTCNTAWTNCINVGDIYADSGKGGRVGGVAGREITDAYTAENLINTGDVTFKLPETINRQPVAGITSYGDPDFTNCVNLGNIITPATNLDRNGTTPFWDGICVAGQKRTNCYTISVDGRHEKKSTVIAPFTTTASESNSRVFATSINTAAYGIIETVINNIKTAGVDVDFEFGAIITLSDYLDPNAGEGKFISEFTHKAFNDYLEANKTTNAKLVNIDALYMTATFPEGAGLVADGDNSVANVYLGGNLYDTTYVAKAYIKVCDGVYIYSK